jgi:CubicO group peptidase (beta-lactamase class C family)
MGLEIETVIPGSADMRDMALRVLLLGGALWGGPLVATAADWSEEQIAKLPSGEEPVRLFNGKNTDGWEGHVGKYFFVENGEIVGRNSQENAPKSSTYLLTKKSYRNFRLIFESVLVTSEMHSGISLWGKAIEKDSGPFTYQGHLVMYPSGYGYYDLFRRNSIFTDKLGLAKAAGKQHEWNKMEIVATGCRIRHVVNGRLVADWSDPQPELCGEGPIGLQLHSNTVPQEVRWRGLVLTENPRDALVTATTRDAGLLVDANPAESGVDAEALKKLDERMQGLVDEKQAAGIVTLVARRGRVVHTGAAGMADVARGRAIAKDSVFAIASMTKPITTAALMILVDEGKVKLDDQVSKYVPSFANTKVKGGVAPAREITVKDCLMHTNGLVGDQRNVGSLANTGEFLAKTELAFDPGTKWQYGPGLSVAGRVVEVASGATFEEFLAKRVFEPLAMKETTFRPTPAMKARLALLYQPTADKKGLEPGKHWLYDVPDDLSPNPSGGLFSTAWDVCRFHQMVLNGGELDGKRVLSTEAVRQMTTLQSGELVTGFSPGSGWGLGFSYIREPQGPTAMATSGTYGHGGAFGTQAWVDPNRELVTVFMVARQGFAGGPDLRAEFHRLAVESIKD